MTDRELLELAAKAAGIDIVRSRLDDPLSRDFLVNASARNPHQVSGPWNSLTDDGDALRLAVKLKIDVMHDSKRGERYVYAYGIGHRPSTAPEEPHGDDPYAATRRAIVRAAAEIGRAMK